MCTCKNCIKHLKVAILTARAAFSRVKIFLDDPLLSYLLKLGISATKRQCGAIEYAAVEFDILRLKTNFSIPLLARAQESIDLGLDDDHGCQDGKGLLQARLQFHPFWQLDHSDRLLLYFFAWAGSLALFETKFLPRLLQN
jgi:hypothetical protein